MSSSRIRVGLVDDQPLFTMGIAMVVDAQPDMVAVGTASDGIAGIELVRATRPDVLLMDLRMPRMNGIQATKALLAELNDDAPAVVVLTTIEKDEAVYQALQAGARAFLTKDARPADVLTAIRSAASDHTLARADDTKALIDRFHDSALAADSVETLTPREREVLLLVARGLSNAAIASRLHLSEATVKTHVRALLQKMNLRSRVQLVIAAYESGLVRS